MTELKKTIPYGRQSISVEDVKAVCDVLRSDWITQGPTVEMLEKDVASFCGAKYAVAVCNGTSALHIACLAISLKKGKKLWTSPITFVASANCALYCGAEIDFVDIDQKTYNMSVFSLEEKLEKAEIRGKLPDVIVPVHFAGQSCEMEKMYQLKQKYGFKIIEDASHALGGKYQKNRIGSCQYSEMTIFSFHPVKTITSGEGGIVLTNCRELYQKLVLFRSHGITRHPNILSKENPAPWYYEQIELGMNYRITDIQAALGVSQLKRIGVFVKQRNKLADRYNKDLNNLPVELPWINADCFSAYHLYVIRLKLHKISNNQRQVFEFLHKMGILVNLHYIPVHLQPLYRKIGFKIGDFPLAEKYYKEAISIPLFYELKEDERKYVVSKLREVLK